MGNYVTVVQVKEYLPDLGVDYDAVLTDIITAVEADVERECQRVFTQQVGVVKLFDGNNRRSLMVPDLVSVTQLRIKYASTDAFSVVPATDYFLEPGDRDAGRPALWLELTDVPTIATRFYAGKRTVEVTGTWGWPAVPAAILETCRQQTIRRWRNRGGADEGDSVQAGAVGGNVARSGLPADVIRTLANFARPVLVA